MPLKLPPLTDHPAYRAAIETRDALAERAADVDQRLNAAVAAREATRNPAAVAALLDDPSANINTLPTLDELQDLQRERRDVRQALAVAGKRVDELRGKASRELQEKAGVKAAHEKTLQALNVAAAEFAKALAAEREVRHAVEAAGYSCGPAYLALHRPGDALVDHNAPYHAWVAECREAGYDLKPLIPRPEPSRSW